MMTTSTRLCNIHRGKFEGRTEAHDQFVRHEVQQSRPQARPQALAPKPIPFVGQTEARAQYTEKKAAREAAMKAKSSYVKSKENRSFKTTA